MVKTLLNSLVTASTILAAGLAQAETLTLTNGDKLSGEVLATAPEGVQLQTTYGILTIPITEIASMENGLPTDRLAPMVAEAQVVAPQPAKEEKAEEKAAVPQKKTGWWGAEWSGLANLGANLKTGNSEQNSIAADAEMKAKWLRGGDIKHRATVKFEWDREEDEGTLTVDERALAGMYDYFLDKKWFVNSSLEFEQDEISDIDLRTVAGLGLGYQMYERDDLHLQFVAGPSYIREEFEDGDSNDSIAARFATDYDQKIWDDWLTLFHDHELLVPTDVTGDFLIDTKSGLRIPLQKNFIASFEVEFDWDNEPEPGLREEDTTYGLKLGYEWK